MPVHFATLVCTVLHSYVQLKHTLRVQLVNATLQTCNFVAMLNRVRTLIIRWCRVRLTGGAPVFVSVDTIVVRCAAVKHSRAQCCYVNSQHKTLQNSIATVAVGRVGCV